MKMLDIGIIFVLFYARCNASCANCINVHKYGLMDCLLKVEDYKPNVPPNYNSDASQADEMLLEWSENVPFKVQGSQEFSVIDDSVTSNFRPPYSDPLGNYSTLHAHLRFERASTGYEVMYIGPPILIALLALFSLLFNHFGANKGVEAYKDDSGNEGGSRGNEEPLDLIAKLTTSVGALNSTVMLWAGIYSKLPPVPVLSMLDGWMLAHIILMGIITIAHSVIHVLRSRLKYLVCDKYRCVNVLTGILFGVLLIFYIVFVVAFTELWKYEGKKAEQLSL